MRFLNVLTMMTALVAAPAYAQSSGTTLDDRTDPTEDSIFTLGQIIVTAPRLEGIDIGQSSVSSEAIYTFNRNSLDEAANIIPGVSASSTGGSRNERLIFVRGFDRFQVPLSIDGIRVYLPADNRLDYGRFLTPDIAEIQVAKGYVSVLDGPGAMGGAINLVTRKPGKELEAEARATLSLDRDGDYAGYNAFALLGTRQDRFYVQGSYARNFQDHWDLAGGFEPTSNQSSGERDFTRTRDWRVNVKTGFTPNATDEYSISYTRQEGSKNAPLHVTDPVERQRNWTWPYWNIDSIYFLSTTGLTDRATIKTRIYRNSFNNLLRTFDDVTQTTQTRGRAFNSYYEDEAYGGSAQLDLALSSAGTFKIAAHYRRDRHVEYQQGFPSGSTEPPQVNEEDTWSIAAENTLKFSPEFSFIAGISYDWRDLKRAEEYGEPPEGGPDRIFSYPIRNADAVNGHAQFVWTPDMNTRLHLSVASRARFPTVFERFSSRFGGATSNPDLKAERATHYELGSARNFGPLRAEGVLFYSRITDAIVAFPMLFNGEPVTQSRNLGKGEYYGAEIALNAALSPTLTLGANYTYTKRDLDDPGNAAFRPTGVPTHKAFAFAEWTPTERLRIVPNIDISSDRWVSDTAASRYFRTGNYIMANLRIDYEIFNDVEIGIGGRNLFDEYYQLADGFPEKGRSFFASVRARY